MTSTPVKLHLAGGRLALGLLSVLAAVPLALPTSSAAAGLLAVRSYGLPAGEALELDVPLRWRETIRGATGEQQITVIFEPDDGREFTVHLQISVPSDPALTTTEGLHSLILSRASQRFPGTDPALIPLQELRGTGGEGYAFSARDRLVPDPPPPGVWPNMTQGAVALGSRVLLATVLSNLGRPGDVADALAIVRSARIVAGSGDPGRTAADATAAIPPRTSFTLDVSDAFAMKSERPLLLTHLATGARIEIRAESRITTARDELKRLELEQDLTSPEQWTTRRSRVVEHEGLPACEFSFTDDRLGLAVQRIVLVGKEGLVTASWESTQRFGPESEKLSKELWKSLRLVEP